MAGPVERGRHYGCRRQIAGHPAQSVPATVAAQHGAGGGGPGLLLR